MAKPRARGRATRDEISERGSARSKRDAILVAATAQFGDKGYEYTMWRDVAAEVGIGPTALYHYFESKLHCLLVIMADAITSFQADFERITGDHEDPLTGLVAVLRSGFDLRDQDVLRNRVLVAEQGLVGIPRTTAREEQARELARRRTRDLEDAWESFLRVGIELGVIPPGNAQLLTRATLGLYNSVWHWYRPRGEVGLDELGRFIVRRQLAVLSLPMELADDPTIRAGKGARGPTAGAS